MIEEKDLNSEETNDELANAETDSEKPSDSLPNDGSKATKSAKKAGVKKPRSKKRGHKKVTSKSTSHPMAQAKFPRHTLARTLRIPAAMLEQNAGRDCPDKEAMEYVGVTLNGERRMEISSAIKYGVLDRPTPGNLRVTDLARMILRPQQDGEDLIGKRTAVLQAPDIAEVYQHYRGENLPDPQFFDNALVDTFHIPQANLSQFKNIFIEVLKDVGLIEQNGDKWRVIDVSSGTALGAPQSETFKKLERSVSVDANDSCFVIMPFAPPLGNHYSLIYEPAIEEAGLKPIRADNDIFATGKIMDQVWRGLRQAKVLVAELTSRNPNVFYELGLAHALKKPVVLISANEEDVPFDVRHIRVIYYDVNDPFWGQKLMKKVSENILSALKNPEEAIFKGPEEG